MNGEFVCADQNRSDAPIVANRQGIGPWETFTQVDRGGGKIALKACNGKFVCARGGSGSQLFANQDSADSWETFTPAQDGQLFTLQAYNGQYVTAEGGGGGLLVANRAIAGSWEKFVRIENPPQTNASRWMTDYWLLLSKRSLRQLCVPGSHDAGMSFSNWAAPLVNDWNTLTQSGNVLDQLRSGSRFFDLRPFVASTVWHQNIPAETFYTYHGDNLAAFALGESLESIVEGLNQFTVASSLPLNEFVILNFSHDRVVQSLGITASDASNFDQKHWVALAEALKRLNYKLERSSQANALTDIPIESLGQEGKPQIILIFPSGASIN